MKTQTFVIDCPNCKAKVAAIEKGNAKKTGFFSIYEGGPYGFQLHIGECPQCHSLLAGKSSQICFEGYDSEYDEWSEVTRVYPDPPKLFTSYSIPEIVKNSLLEADKSLQAGANTASCAMMGRALEAVCRDKLQTTEPSAKTTQKQKKIMLGAGVEKLKKKGMIDERLYSWSQELKAFRDIAAHPDETIISREDAEDLQSFVHAIVEYIYDLSEKYEDFKRRIEKREQRTKSNSRVS